MPRRSKVELYEQIRKAHQREEASIRTLAGRFHVQRRDGRQALASATPPDRKPVVRPSPVLDPWKPTIDAWLEADRTAPRKQRHTARRVWQRLVDEHGAAVGESSVRRYVAQVRRRQSVPLVEAMVPQHHRLGEEAEVDFGSIHVYLAGVLTELPLFLMRLSASGGGFVPRCTRRLKARMDGLLAVGDRDRVVELLFRELENMSDEDMAVFKAAPSWSGRAAAAHTITREIHGERTARLDLELDLSITVPVLLVTGEHSVDSSKPHAETVAAALPNARIVVLDGQEHVADALAPEAFAAQIVPFLKSAG